VIDGNPCNYSIHRRVASLCQAHNLNIHDPALFLGTLLSESLNPPPPSFHPCAPAHSLWSINDNQNLLHQTFPTADELSRSSSERTPSSLVDLGYPFHDSAIVQALRQGPLEGAACPIESIGKEEFTLRYLQMMANPDIALANFANPPKGKTSGVDYETFVSVVTWQWRVQDQWDTVDKSREHVEVLLVSGRGGIQTATTKVVNPCRFQKLVPEWPLSKKVLDSVLARPTGSDAFRAVRQAYEALARLKSKLHEAEWQVIQSWESSGLNTATLRATWPAAACELERGKHTHDYTHRVFAAPNQVHSKQKWGIFLRDMGNLLAPDASPTTLACSD
jgi:hypothetical protein